VQSIWLLAVKAMSSHSKLIFLLAAAVLALSCLANAPSAFGQSGLDEVHVIPRMDPAQPDGAGINPSLDTHTKPIRKDVDLVLVPVTITDPMGRLVTGLAKNRFRVFEGKQQQEIQHFSAEDVPISLGIIFDTSSSMRDKIERAREAVVQFCGIANPQDEFFMITFSDTPQLATDFTSRVANIQSGLALTQARGRTALLDAIYLGVNEMRQAKHQRKALLIISDGGDNRSRYTEHEIRSLVMEADVMIYAVGIYDRNFVTPEESRGPDLLNEIAGFTGGRAFALDNPNQLPDVADRIGTELRNQYVLGYRPEKAPHDGKWHKIKVSLSLPKGFPFLRVNARAGYYASTQ